MSDTMEKIVNVLEKQLMINAELIDRVQALEKTLKEYNIETRTIKSFNAREWVKVSGRGNLCIIDLTEEFYSKDVIYRDVIIDGKSYYVTGMECHAKYREDHPIRGLLFKAGETVSMLIRGEV